jgi:hypothetical protein
MMVDWKIADLFAELMVAASFDFELAERYWPKKATTVG